MHLWQIQAVRDLLLIAVIIALVWAGYALRTVTVPLLVALLLAYLFEPVVAKWSRQRHMNRPVVVSGLLLGLVLFVLAVLAIVVPLLVGQTLRLVDDLRSGRFEQSLIALRERIPEAYQADYDHALDYFGGILRRPQRISEPGDLQPSPPDEPQGEPPAPGAISEAQLRELVRTEIATQLDAERSAAPGVAQLSTWLAVARRSAEAIFAFLGRVLQIGFLLFLIPFYFFFFSLWYPQVVAFGRSLIPPGNEVRTTELLAKMDRAVAGFVRGRIVISVLMGIMFAIGWSLYGVPYAVLLGIVVGVFCAVPYLGAVGVPLAVGLLWFKQINLPAEQQMSVFWIIAGPVLVYTVVQLIESYILTPMIAGKATNLDPVTILVAVLAGGSVAGVYGMLVAIPVAACGKILFSDVLLPRVRSWVRGEARDPLPLQSG